MSSTANDVEITRLTTEAERLEELRRDVVLGLTAAAKSLPPKYFYDERGSALFDHITRLDEYYPTRTETSILEDVGRELMAGTRPDELIEIGSGYSRKTRLLLESMHELGGDRYVAFDVSEDAIQSAAEHLSPDYEWLQIEGVVGDFHRHLGQIPRHGRGLLAFLGSTIGNLFPDERAAFLADVAGMLRDDDRLLLGVDLVKDVATIEAAYNDASGVTAEFNKNVLHVLNRELDANFDPADFRHRAVFDPEHSWVDIGLVAERAVQVELKAIRLEVAFDAGELLQTEVSTKFTRAALESDFAAAGLQLERWDTDADERFALVLAGKA